MTSNTPSDALPPSHEQPAPSTPPDRSAGSRRAFLATAGTSALLAAAGCLDALDEPTEFDWVGEEVDEPEQERHQTFGPDEDVIFTVRRLPTLDATAEGAPLGFEALLHHRSGLRTDDFRVGVRAVPTDGGSSFERVAAMSPANDRSMLTVTRDVDGWALFELGPSTVPGARSFGVANVALEFLVTLSRLHPVDELFVAVDATLSEQRSVGRRRYQVRRLTTFPLV